eukprot:6200422-Pleurochrysis_carterae.AAC.3
MKASFITSPLCCLSTDGRMAVSQTILPQRAVLRSTEALKWTVEMYCLPTLPGLENVKECEHLGNHTNKAAENGTFGQFCGPLKASRPARRPPSAHTTSWVQHSRRRACCRVLVRPPRAKEASHEYPMPNGGSPIIWLHNCPCRHLSSGRHSAGVPRAITCPITEISFQHREAEAWGHAWSRTAASLPPFTTSPLWSLAYFCLEAAHQQLKQATRNSVHNS